MRWKRRSVENQIGPRRRDGDLRGWFRGFANRTVLKKRSQEDSCIPCRSSSHFVILTVVGEINSSFDHDPPKAGAHWLEARRSSHTSPFHLQTYRLNTQGPP